MRIEIENLSKTIRHAAVLNDVNMSLDSGKIYGFRGINGSGKTMLMRAICGLIRPTVGAVVVDGMTIGKDISFPPHVGALIETPAFINKYTGFKNLKALAMIQNRVDDDVIRQSLCDVGLNPDDKRVYRKYSLGMKQRLGIAAAVMEEPELILLDEPFNALDEAGIESVKNLLVCKRGKGALIILASHDLEGLELLADEMFVLSEGTVTKHYEVAS
jgi:ABC-2 type transport system ATP-binding protein